MKTVQLLESLINQTADAIGVIDTQNRFIVFNPAYEKMFGWTKEELEGKPIPIVPDFLREETEAIYRRVEAGETFRDYATFRQKKDGSIIPVNVTISPVYDKDGKLIGKSGIIRDVSEHYAHLKELNEINERYSLIANNMLDVIVLSDLEGNYLYVSPSYERFTGKKSISNAELLEIVHPDDKFRVKRVIKRTINTFTPGRVEYRLIRNDGRVLSVETVIVPFENMTGKKIIMTTRDISKRKEAEELLKISEKKMMLGDLAAGIAHEIRNPLTSLRGFLQMFYEKGSADQAQFELMFSEIDRINEIVSELLLLSKPHGTNYEVIDLIQVLEDVVLLLNSEATNKKSSIQVNWNVPSAIIFGCQNRLKQVFINLIKNAIESMEQGGIVTISIDKNNENYYVTKICDQGKGISSKDLLKIGTPFYTTKENGTGLGLMISKKIILEDHDGDFKIDSEEGKGTTVTITLPSY